MNATQSPMLDVARLDKQLEQARNVFVAAVPFKHVIIDDFLTDAVARRVHHEFPIPARTQRAVARLLEARSYRVERRHRPKVRALLSELGGAPFTAWVRALTGIDDAQMDPANIGGGLHQGMRGSRLHVHADHNTHPGDRARYRRINVLLYLNPAWCSTWGGELELWDAACRRVVTKIEPRFNRCVVMEVHDYAFHGYRHLNVPFDATRDSLAAYFYSASPAALQARAAHPTLFGREVDETIASRVATRLRRIVLRRFLPRFVGLPQLDPDFTGVSVDVAERLSKTRKHGISVDLEQRR